MANGIDQPSEKKQNTPNSFAKNFWSEYDGRESEYDFTRFSETVCSQYIDNSSSLADIFRAIPGQPPEFI